VTTLDVTAQSDSNTVAHIDNSNLLGSEGKTSISFFVLYQSASVISKVKCQALVKPKNS
jgi:hypothetical protein